MLDYTVMIESEDGTEQELAEFETAEEARHFCDAVGGQDWLYADENGFHWEMYIRNNRI